MPARLRDAPCITDAVYACRMAASNIPYRRSAAALRTAATDRHARTIVAPRGRRRLDVRFPKSKLHTVSTATELVERHPGCARVHGVVPKEAADRIEHAIHVVDTVILNVDPVAAILDPIFGHNPSPGPD